ncbi:MAG: sugar transferase [Flavobacteriaceae bacterium]|nr:sugar transferase [Flavobacteriaceae bacterium]
MLSKRQQALKRLFDLIFSIAGILIFCVPVIFLVILASFSTGRFGIFSQLRIGQGGKPFVIYKIRTMYAQQNASPITQFMDPRLTPFGRFLRTTHLDELPQLYNILIGTMSFVGPRPDVPGYADKLTGDDRIILSVKPGITGPATIRFKNEDRILAVQADPQKYNDTVLWIEKVKINREYVENWSFLGDLNYIFATIFPKFDRF